MSRSIKTWFILSAILAVSVQPALAGKPKGGGGSRGGGGGGNSVRRLTGSAPKTAVRSNNLGNNNISKAVPRNFSNNLNNNSHNNNLTRNLAPRTPRVLNPTPFNGSHGTNLGNSIASPGNLVRNNPINVGNNNLSNNIPSTSLVPRPVPVTTAPIMGAVRDGRVTLPTDVLHGSPTVITNNPPLSNVLTPRDGRVTLPTDVMNGSPTVITNGPPLTNVVTPRDGRVTLPSDIVRGGLPDVTTPPATGLPVGGNTDVGAPVTPTDGLPDHITPPDEIGTAVPDADPLPTPPIAVPDEVAVGIPDDAPADEIGTAVPDLEPIENPAPPAEDYPSSPVDPGSLLSSIGDLISQFAGGGGGGRDASGGGGSAVEEAPAAVETAAPVEETPAEEPKEVATEEKKADAMDIELTEVLLIEAGSVEHKVGPRFRLFCRNNGTVEAPKFQVTVLVDAAKELTAAAHVVTVESIGMKPGKTQSVDVQLPVEALKMVMTSGKPAKPYETLGAFIDSDNSLEESDEKNNLLLLARKAIKSVKTAEVAKRTTTEEPKMAKTTKAKPAKPATAR